MSGRSASAFLLETENQLQISCVEYLRRCARPDVRWHHSPNELCTTKPKRIHQWKMGMLSGFPDLLLIREGLDCNGCDRPWMGFCELKVGHESLSEDQFDCRMLLERLGFPYRIVRSLDTFMEACVEWELVR